MNNNPPIYPLANRHCCCDCEPGPVSVTLGLFVLATPALIVLVTLGRALVELATILGLA